MPRLSSANSAASIHKVLSPAYAPLPQTARLLDGKLVAGRILERAASDVRAALAKNAPRAPSLAVIQVGDRQDSSRYVRAKKLACEKVGVESSKSLTVAIPADESRLERVLEAELARLNEDPGVDGILIQLPLPDSVDSEKILSMVSASKDVDGFHPLNVGKLVRHGEIARQRAKRGLSAPPPPPAPCTPAGVMHLLRHYEIPLKGKSAVVLGRSNIVGMPMSHLLLHEDASVTVLHSGTPKDAMMEACREADVVVAAVGRAQLVKGDWIKPNATVIDVGINHLNGKLVGDVDFEEVSRVAGYLSPVPGGVGPLTVAMLVKGTVDRYLINLGQQ